MFSSLTSRIMLGIFVVIVLAIPIGAYVLSSRSEEAAETDSKPNPPPKTITSLPSAKPSTSPKPAASAKPAAAASQALPSATPSSAIAFGPTMDFKVALEGRPDTYHGAKVFLGIADGIPVVKPTYLLIYSVDVDASGQYRGLSLAGLSAGQEYTAYIKGPAQIDSAFSFIMASTLTTLNSGLPIDLLSGDLNEDNVVNSADYAILSSSFGSNENSPNWNSLADFNRDGVINTVDIAIIVKNFGKVGATGPVISTPSQASSSAQLNQTAIGGPEEATMTPQPPSNPFGQKGHWLWVPDIE